jgi:hypothetical protein
MLLLLILGSYELWRCQQYHNVHIEFYESRSGVLLGEMEVLTDGMKIGLSGKLLLVFASTVVLGSFLTSLGKVQVR